jgi:hypothetical protein
MSKLFKFISVIVILITINSCDEMNKEYNIKFIKEHGTETFNDFINYGIITRGTDRVGNLVLFVSDFKDNIENGPYIVKIDNKSNNIVQSSCKLMSDSSKVNRKKLDSLALKFLLYNVNLLKVDSNKNVFVNVLGNKRPTLVRFSDIKYKTGVYNTDWEKIKETNWYEDELNP